MTPALSKNTVAIVVCALCLGAIGVLRISPELMSLSATAALILVAAILADGYLHPGNKPFDVQFRWLSDRQSKRQLTVTGQQDFTLHFELINNTAQRLDVVRIDVLHSSGIQHEASRSLRCQYLKPGINELSVRFRCLASGYHALRGITVHLQGSFGVFMHELYFRQLFQIRAIPTTTLHRSPAAPPRIAQSRTTRTVSSLMDFHQLRLMQPGDPFKAIAWKPSARLNRFVVRQTLHEEQRRHHILVDFSGSALLGNSGNRPADAYVQYVTGLSRWLLSKGSHLSIEIFTGKRAQKIERLSKKEHYVRVQRFVLDALESYTLSEIDLSADDLVDVAAEYAQRNEGLSIDGYDPATLVAHILRSDLRTPCPVSAKGETARLLLQYCAARKLELPRCSAADETKADWLSRSIYQPLKDTVHFVCICEPFEDRRHQFWKAVQHARGKGHFVSIVSSKGPLTLSKHSDAATLSAHLAWLRRSNQLIDFRSTAIRNGKPLIML